MKIGFRTDTYSKIACDLLSFPVFEEDLKPSRTLNLLDSLTGGMVSKFPRSGIARGDEWNKSRILIFAY